MSSRADDGAHQSDPPQQSDMTGEGDTSPTNIPPASRKWLFRLLAVLLGLSPLLVLEAGLRVAGFQGRETSELDPFVRFESVRPLFELTAGAMAIPPSRQEYFRPEQFEHPKPNGQFRIFCLGGSTVQGRPFAIETSYTTWLELALKAASPSQQWDVINCGGVSYASYRLTPILAEVLDYSPDLIILYTGHNEFLEDRTYASWRARPAWARRASQTLECSRVFRLAQAVGARRNQADQLPAEVDAMLDYRGGLADYRRDDRWQSAIADHYAVNVGRMIDLAAAAGVPMIICNPVANLETPPFKSEQQESKELKERERFDQLWEQATADGSSSDERIASLQEAVALSPRNAAAQFYLATCLQAAGRFEASHRHFIRAKDEDVCPLRMTEPLCQRLRSVVVQRQGDVAGLAWCDVRANFEKDSEGGITGDRWLVDHVHPSIHGHQKIAQWLVEVMESLDMVSVGDDFPVQRDKAFQKHLAEIPTIYFEQAKRRLEGLQRWSQGRAFKARLSRDSSSEK